MDSLFVSRLVVSFCIAGIWIAAVTLLAERLGSKLGGLFTNLPSNILISLLFVAFINGSSYAVNSVPGIPIGMAINTLFLFVFIVTIKYGLFLSTFASLASWLIIAYAASLIEFQNLWLNCLLYLVVTISSFGILEKIFKIPSAEKSSKQYTKIQIAIRVLFAGTIVSAVIISSKFLNPYLFGIFSTFPAVLLSTMVILVINQDKKFAQATGKILILSSSNIVVYGLVVYLTFEYYGIVMGTAISFGIAFAWVWVFHPILTRIS